MGFRDLLAFTRAFALSVKIFEISKDFPPEEKYSLTDQIIRCSRSVCSNIGEAYRKRKYPKHYISKLSNSDGENTENQVRLNFSIAFQYIAKKTHKTLMIDS